MKSISTMYRIQPGRIAQAVCCRASKRKRIENTPEIQQKIDITRHITYYTT
jgi:hypothetical protein